MSTTEWERRKSVADRLRGVWDAKRDGREWREVYAEAQEAVALRCERDAAIAREVTFEEFMRLQGVQL